MLNSEWSLTRRAVSSPAATGTIERIALPLSVFAVLVAVAVKIATEPVSFHRIRDGNLFEVSYYRYTRVGTDNIFSINIRDADDEKTTIQLPQGFLDNYTIYRIDPQPESMDIKNEDGAVLTFAASAEGSMRVAITAAPKSYGRLSHNIKTASGSRSSAVMTIHQVVLP